MSSEHYPGEETNAISPAHEWLKRASFGGYMQLLTKDRIGKENEEDDIADFHYPHDTRIGELLDTIEHQIELGPNGRKMEKAVRIDPAVKIVLGSVGIFSPAYQGRHTEKGLVILAKPDEIFDHKYNSEAVDTVQEYQPEGFLYGMNAGTTWLDPVCADGSPLITDGLDITGKRIKKLVEISLYPKLNPYASPQKQHAAFAIATTGNEAGTCEVRFTNHRMARFLNISPGTGYILPTPDYLEKNPSVHPLTDTF